MIKAVLMDVEERQVQGTTTHSVRDWVDKLRAIELLLIKQTTYSMSNTETGHEWQVLVTTRSREVARIMGEYYGLGYLSEEDSWSLFRKMGKGEKKWRSCMDNELARIDEAGNIMSILKFSYQHLRSPLKYRFASCALLPKDTTINKEKLIKLWMAHGFIVPSYENQSFKDVGEEYFNHLLQSLNSPCKIPCFLPNAMCLRTFLLPEHVSTGSYFRTSFCKLIHMRYLDLSNLPIKRLPNSITKLLNLHTLKLDDCLQLKEIPVNIEKLINLRHLSVSNCELAYMPHGICQLTSLHRLDWFLVKLEPVAYCCPSSKPKMDLDDGRNDKAILEGLQPHHNLRKLLIEGYGDDSFPNWASLGGLSLALPNLLHIELNNLPTCRHLPSFGELAFLEKLILLMLEKVEYMETGKLSLPPSSTSQPATTLCFPSLKRLTLFRMYELKGWLEALGEENQHLSWPSFPKLSKLSIINCPKLQSMPFSPFF
uniref:Uncharacterized protein n=1 Tax=Chenopodium quinoa TaxID=63459 RepID=A0A803M608_CHEQI